MGRIRVGTSSWTDRELLESGWYPQGARTPEQRLRHYATRFPLVEVDSTYYTPPSERNSVLWSQRTPDGFRFHVKAFSLLTGHPTRVAAIHRDLRPDTRRSTVTAGDLPPAVVDAVWERFLSALEPLHASGRLGAVLLQFPPRFVDTARNREHLVRCAQRCRPYRACVELRSATWMREGARDDVLALLRSHDVSYVCVDAPRGHPSSVPPVAAVTAEPAVVRFHGRSPHWSGGDAQERFRHRYAREELAEWVPRVLALAEEADVHLLFNTCCGDSAQVAARQMADLLPAGLLVAPSA
ncbi:DUF72 domain-containing protein [Quadrisphaera sp. DSM 44207]|uniref:DUF72 domain-containing protein n=1 Tax=Quadrisphaera sp. DSM 44207 TaxID=1881057 RepID=UPI00088F31B8|nr:DUF72 domain-containing protein [Quadrisphaera sp. DSM 44207]SDQ04835.1 Uncharacterized conserved protein YecE, DUF72 family [Quadrisphaera sp. DSM 44207]